MTKEHSKTGDPAVGSTRLLGLTCKRLQSGYWHIRGDGPCNWAQPPYLPCDETTMTLHTFPEAGEIFRAACRELIAQWPNHHTGKAERAGSAVARRTPDMTMRKKLTKPLTRRLLKPVGSGRRCQWLMELKGWNDCGRPATDIRSDCGLAYCTDHAQLMMPYTAFQPIAPNTELSDGRGGHSLK